MRSGQCNISVDWVDRQRKTQAHGALERLQGLLVRPEEVLAGPPVVIARHIPLQRGERVKEFLEQHGIGVSLEPCDPGLSGRHSKGPAGKMMRQEFLVQQICTHLATKVPGFVSDTIRKGLTSMSGSLWKACVGLVLGGLLGWGLAFLFWHLYSAIGTPELKTLPESSVYVYMLVINGVCGIGLGWYVGLKKELKGAVVGNESVLDLVDATVGDICRFLEINGLTPEGRKQFLSGLQGRMNEEQIRIHEAVHGNLKQLPLMRGTSFRMASRILQAACRIPEMILLNMDMTPREGSGQKTMLVEGFFSRLDRVFGNAVDAAFGKPIFLLILLMTILAGLPFAVMIAQAAVW